MTFTESDKLEKAKVDDTKQQLFGYLTAHLVVANLQIGEKLGLFPVLIQASEVGGITIAELARKTNIANKRLLKEWALCLLSNRLLDYVPKGNDEDDLYYMTKETGMFFTLDGNANSGIWPLVASTTCLPSMCDFLVERYKTGTGMNWGNVPEPLREGITKYFGPMYENFLPLWLSKLHIKLASKLDAGALVIDMGCGQGVSSCTMAKHFPKSKIVGVDYHSESIDKAKHLAHTRSLSNINFLVADASAKYWHNHGEADVVAFFDCWHDMQNPVEAAKEAFEALKDGGIVVLVEPLAADLPGIDHALKIPSVAIESGCSALVCTPSSLGSEGCGAGFGTCIPTTVHKKVFMEAGFTSVISIPGDENDPSSPIANGSRFIVVEK